MEGYGGRDRDRDRDGDDKKRERPERDKHCRFCRENAQKVDYKDVETLTRYCTAQGKIFSRKRSGTCAGHQRDIKIAIKRARFLALMPYSGS